MDTVGLGPAYRERTGASLYTVEAHVRYLDQVGPGEQLEARSWVIGATGEAALDLARAVGGRDPAGHRGDPRAARRQRFSDQQHAVPRRRRRDGAGGTGATRPGRVPFDPRAADERLLLAGLGRPRGPHRRRSGRARPPEHARLVAGRRPRACCRCAAAPSRWGPRTPRPCPGDGEGPVREVLVEPFAIDAHCVSNERFAAFVDATGHVTDAERYGWSFVFDGLPARRRCATTTGRSRHRGGPRSPGPSWRQPEGPGSDLADRADHPVVHVSWNDAVGLLPVGRGPAAHRGRVGVRRARWPAPGPLRLGRRPAARRQARAATSGRAASRPPTPSTTAGSAPPRSTPSSPTASACSTWPATSGSGRPTRGRWAHAVDPGARVIRGGSYLCHASYCNRYRVSARTLSTPDSSTGHQGFRVAL